MKGRADDAGPDPTFQSPSELVEDVLAMLENAGVAGDVCARVVARIEKYEASLLGPGPTADDEAADYEDDPGDCDFCGGSGVDDRAPDDGTDDYDVCPHCGGLG